MAERIFLSLYWEQPNGDLLKDWVREVSADDVLRMEGINPDEYWALSEGARKCVHENMQAGIDGAEALALAQSTSATVN